MNDFSQVIEYSVRRDQGKHFGFFRVFVPIISIAAALIIGAFLFGIYGPAIGGLMTVVLIAVSSVFCIKRYKIVHYDYRMVQNELYFAKIVNRKKRKELGSVNISTLDVIAPYNGSHKESANRVSYDNIYDFSSSINDPETYYAVETDDETSAKTIFFFTPSDKMLRAMRIYNRHTVIVKEHKE